MAGLFGAPAPKPIESAPATSSGGIYGSSGPAPTGPQSGLVGGPPAAAQPDPFAILLQAIASQQMQQAAAPPPTPPARPTQAAQPANNQNFNGRTATSHFMDVLAEAIPTWGQMRAPKASRSAMRNSGEFDKFYKSKFKGAAPRRQGSYARPGSYDELESSGYYAAPSVSPLNFSR